MFDVNETEASVISSEDRTLTRNRDNVDEFDDDIYYDEVSVCFSVCHEKSSLPGWAPEVRSEMALW